MAQALGVCAEGLTSHPNVKGNESLRTNLVKKQNKTGRLICPSLPFRSLHYGETGTAPAETTALYPQSRGGCFRRGGARAALFSESCLSFVWPLSSTILKRGFFFCHPEAGAGELVDTTETSANCPVYALRCWLAERALG